MTKIVDRKYIIEQIRNGNISYARDSECVQDFEIVYELLKQNGNLLYEIANDSNSAVWLNDGEMDKEMLLAAVKSNGYALNAVMALAGADSPLLRDKEVIMTALHNQPKAIQFVPQDLKNDPDIVAAIEQTNNEEFIPVADERVKQIIKNIQNGNGSSYISNEECRQNRYIVEALLKADGRNLWELANDGNSAIWGYSGLDRDMVITAMKSNGLALSHLRAIEGAEELLRDKQVIIAALTSQPQAKQFVPADLLNDPDIIALTETKKEEKQAEVIEEKQDEKIVEAVESFEKQGTKLEELDAKVIANKWSFGKIIDIVKQRALKLFNRETKNIGEKEKVPTTIKSKIGKKIAVFEAAVQRIKEQTLTQYAEEEITELEENQV